MQTAELLSGLRSIEWDLQDLEDTVSIVEGNRQKFMLEESDVQERKDFIANTRKQIVSLRDEVQGVSMAASTPGFSTAKSGPKLPSIGKSKGYGKVGSMDDTVEMMAAHEDMEHGNGGSSSAPPNRLSNDDEILGAEPDAYLGDDAAALDRGRHRRKKCCLAVCVSVLLVGGAVFAALNYTGRDGGAGAAIESAIERGEAALSGTILANATGARASPAGRRRALLHVTRDDAPSTAPAATRVRATPPHA